ACAETLDKQRGVVMKFQKLLKLRKGIGMRAQAELAATTERLAEAARRGPDPDAVQARLGALKLLVGDIVDDVDNGLPALADGGPGLAGRAARHLVGAGGKRVRPLLVILSARAAGVPADCLATRTSVTRL